MADIYIQVRQSTTHAPVHPPDPKSKAGLGGTVRAHPKATVLASVVLLAIVALCIAVPLVLIKPDGAAIVKKPNITLSKRVASMIPPGNTKADLTAADALKLVCKTPARTALPTIGTVWRNVPRYCCAATGSYGYFGMLLNASGLPDPLTPFYGGYTDSTQSSDTYRGPVFCSQNLADSTYYTEQGCGITSDPDANGRTWLLNNVAMATYGLLMTCASRGHPFDYVDVKVNSICKGAQSTCQSWSYVQPGSGPGNTSLACTDRSSCCIGNSTQTVTPNCVSRGPTDAGKPACYSIDDDTVPPVGTLFSSVPRYCCTAILGKPDAFGLVLGFDGVPVSFNTTYDGKTTIDNVDDNLIYRGPYVCGNAFSNLTVLSGCNVLSTNGKWKLTALGDGVLLKCPAVGDPKDLVDVKVNSICGEEQKFCQPWSKVRKDSAEDGIGRVCEDASSCCVGGGKTLPTPSCV